MSGRSYDFSTWQLNMQQMLGVGDPNGAALFTSIQFQMIDYAELRIYRELDLVNTSDEKTYTMIPGGRFFDIPANDFIVIDSMMVIDLLGVATSLRRKSVEFINIVCPRGNTDVPRYWNTFQETQLLFGPPPAAAYTLEVYGTVRPLPLGPGGEVPTPLSQPTTMLTTEWPDLFLAACMIFGSAYTKNFGQQAEDPKMAMSWESTYQALKSGASWEEARKKGLGVDYSSSSPSPATSAAG